MKVKEIISKLNIDRETLRGWELGLFEPHVKHYPKIIRFLGYYPPISESKTLGGRMKTYRYLKGLTLEQFATLLHTDRTTVWFWETNRRLPISKTVIILENLLKEQPKAKQFPDLPLSLNK